MMIFEFILPLSLILPGLWLLQLARVRTSNIFERLTLSYILSLAMIFGLLYLGGIMKAFNTMSFVVLVIVFVSFIHLFVLFTMKVLRSSHSFILCISAEKIVIALLFIGLLVIYAIFLSSRAILDSDVVQYYLPMAREIVSRNGFTYSTGYDYNILLKPIGVSVLYAWVYRVSGSTLSEAFRLIPLTSIFMLVILNYAIATLATKSQTIGIISTAIFLVLPFHDRFLLYNAFYPDTFYYPLIFSVIYLMLKYLQTKDDSLLPWVGMALGSAGLLKAQTIYSIITILLMLAILHFKSKKLSLVLCSLAPFYIFIPNMVAEQIQHEGLHLSIPVFTPVQLILFLILGMISGFCYFKVLSNISPVDKVNSRVIRNLIRRMFLILIPFITLSGLWYINNFLNFGTILYTSSINLPNYEWAIGVLNSAQQPMSAASVSNYLMYFSFLFIDPAVMGYAWLIPLLLGLTYMSKGKFEILRILLFFEIFLVIMIFSQVVYFIPIVAESAYNPRDILPLAPLLTIIASFGITSLFTTFKGKIVNPRQIVLPFLFIVYFGLVSYAHSVLIWSTSMVCTTLIGKFTSDFGAKFGLTLQQMSFQLPAGNRVIFLSENIWRILIFSLVAGTPLLISVVYGFLKKIFNVQAVRVKINVGKKGLSHIDPKKLWTYAEYTVIILLGILIIIIPRIEVLIAQGGIQEIAKNQLKRNYGAFYEIIVDGGQEFKGDILTFKAPDGLPYYLPGVKVIDLMFPANLAFLKDCLLSNSSYEIVTKLKQQGINYLLVNPTITSELDASLNFAISKITSNPELAGLLRNLDGWQLYVLNDSQR